MHPNLGQPAYLEKKMNPKLNDLHKKQKKTNKQIRF